MYVFFDLDDTLFNHRDAQARAVMTWRRQMLPDTPWSDAELVAMWEAATIRHFRAFERGEIGFREQQRRRIRDIVQEPLKDAAAEELFAAYQPHYEEFWRLFPDVRACLEELKDYRLGVLAHGDPAQQQRKLALFGLADKFQSIIIADEYSARKPSPAFFLRATDTVEISPEDCVYVGDHLQLDALGAKSAGWRGVWLERSGVFTADFGIEVIHGLAELPGVLRKPDQDSDD